jgi:hypothetical protein
MNTQKQAMSKIAKIQKEELSVEKVELALVDDIKGHINYLKNIFDNIEKEGDALGTALADAIRQRRNVDDYVQRASSYKKVADKTIENFKKAAKELGVDANSAEIRQLESAIDEIDVYVKLFNGLGKIPQL